MVYPCVAIWELLPVNHSYSQIMFLQDKYVAALKVSDKIKVVTPDWVVDSINKKTKEDETLYHPNLLEYPRVLSPVVIPEPEPMVAEIPEIVAPSIHRHYQRVSLEEMSGTPSAKEKLARMVSNRLQASGRGVDPQDVRRGMNGVEERGPAPGPRHADLHHRMLKNITNNAESKGPPSRPATIKVGPTTCRSGDCQGRQHGEQGTAGLTSKYQVSRTRDRRYDHQGRQKYGEQGTTGSSSNHQGKPNNAKNRRLPI